MNHFQDAIDALLKASEAYDQGVGEHNELVELLEARDKEIEQNKSDLQGIWDINCQQKAVIEEALKRRQADQREIDRLDAEVTRVRAQLKELQALDPKRLAKQNAELKKKNAQLKEDVGVLRKERAEYTKAKQQADKFRKQEGQAPFWECPETGNTVRVSPKYMVNPENEYGGFPGVPVVEFLHLKSGITRQGVLMLDGNMSWASAANSTPKPHEHAIAKDAVVAWAKAQKPPVKLPKIKRE